MSARSILLGPVSVLLFLLSLTLLALHLVVSIAIGAIALPVAVLGKVAGKVLLVVMEGDEDCMIPSLEDTFDLVESAFKLIFGEDA